MAASGSTTVSGYVYEDVDEDGVYDEGQDVPWEGKGVSIYNDSGHVDTGVTDANGYYEITGLADGDYRLHYHKSSWGDVKYDWVPTTTEEVWPETFVTLDGSNTTFDLGWRPITFRSSTEEPITAVDADSGLRIESYTDAVTAEKIHTALTSGSLLGDERPHTKLRFGYPDATSSCNHSATGTPGSYSNYDVSCTVSYDSWVFDRHRILFHEYGHAWSRYYEKIVNQWGDWDPYLVARGVDPNDDRLGTRHAWAPSEMIAEDFRQLFGTPSAKSYSQENGEIPPAPEVDGLDTWLSTTFMGEGEDNSTPNQDPSVSVSADPASGNAPLDVQFTSDTSDSDGTIASVSWDFGDGNTASEPNPSHTYETSGNYTATLTVTDDDGASATDSVSIEVTEGSGSDDPDPDITDPSVTIDQPSDGATLSDSVSVNVSASDNVDVASVSLSRGNSLIGTDSSSPYSFTWDTTTVSNGDYTLTATATDTSGNTASSSINVSVSNETPDTESPTAPSDLSATAITSDQVSISWNPSSDDTGVSHYQVYRNDRQIGTTTDTVYSDIGLSAGTTYSYYVQAVDSSGNTSPASNTDTATTPTQQLHHLSGTVTDTNGQALAGAKVTLGKGRDALTYTAGSNGYYYIPSLQPDTYDTAYGADGYHDDKQTVTVRNSDVTNDVSLEVKGNPNKGGGNNKKDN